MSARKYIKSLLGKDGPSRTIFLLSAALFAIVSMAHFFPEQLWGVHGWTFLPVSWKWGVWLTAFACLILSNSVNPNLKFPQFDLLYSTRGILLISALSFVVFLSLKIQHDVYGDAEIIMRKIGNSTNSIVDKHYELLTSLDITRTDLGKNTIVAFIQLVSYHFNFTHAEVFNLIDAIFGAIFIGFWLFFCATYFESSPHRILAVTLGVTLPFLYHFFGHLELYAPIFTILTILFSAIALYFKTNSRKWLIVAIAACVVGLKLHFVIVFTFPTIIFLVGHHLNISLLKITWPRVTTIVLIPLLIIGSYLYFFVFQDHIDERILNKGVGIFERLFLPILSPEPPHDRYSLFHANHIWDLLNMGLLLSVSLTLVLFTLVTFRNKINWYHPGIILIGLSTLIFSAFFFMMNPLTGMTLDWDLFSLTAPGILVMVVIGISQLNSSITKEIFYKTLPFVFFNLAFIGLHFDKDSTSKRYEAIGRHSFKTYYERSATCLNAAMKMHEGDYLEHNKRYLQIIDDLQPWAIKGNDASFSFILMNYAQFIRDQMKDPRGALEYFNLAQTYYEDNPANKLGLLNAYYLLKEFDSALHYARELSELKYPSDRQAQRAVIHLQLELEDYENALLSVDEYLVHYPSDSTIVNLHTHLNDSLPNDSLKLIFD